MLATGCGAAAHPGADSGCSGSAGHPGRVLSRQCTCTRRGPHSPCPLPASFGRCGHSSLGLRRPPGHVRRG
eukprot:6642207-Alexandrium_andersonii.AAC.1